MAERMFPLGSHGVKALTLALSRRERERGPRAAAQEAEVLYDAR